MVGVNCVHLSLQTLPLIGPQVTFRCPSWLRSYQKSSSPAASAWISSADPCLSRVATTSASPASRDSGTPQAAVSVRSARSTSLAVQNFGSTTLSLTSPRASKGHSRSNRIRPTVRGQARVGGKQRRGRRRQKAGTFAEGTGSRWTFTARRSR